MEGTVDGRHEWNNVLRSFKSTVPKQGLIILALVITRVDRDYTKILSSFNPEIHQHYTIVD